MKKKYSLMAALWMMGISVVQSQNFSEWFRQNKTQERYLEQQIKALKFYSHQSQRGYERIQKGLMIFAAIEDQSYQRHHSYFDGQGELSAAFYTENQLKKLQTEHHNLCQFASSRIHAFSGKSYNNAALSTLHWNLWKLLRNHQRQLHVLDKLIDSNYFKMGDGDRIAKVEKQKLLIQHQHNQLKSFYVQFIMLSLEHQSN